MLKKPKKATETIVTHSDLVEIGAEFLKRYAPWGKYPFVLKEFRTSAVIVPDVIGFRCGPSWLIECKTNRADFLSGRKKPQRETPGKGVGEKRSYFTFPGVITPEDVEGTNWGLMYWMAEDNKIIEIVQPEKQETDFLKERLILYSLLRRVVRGESGGLHDSAGLDIDFVSSKQG